MQVEVVREQSSSSEVTLFEASWRLSMAKVSFRNSMRTCVLVVRVFCRCPRVALFFRSEMAPENNVPFDADVSFDISGTA